MADEEINLDEESKWADLVLEGGGVKGIGLVGAILDLDRAGWKFKRVAGTSAGAITAALVAALQAAGQPLTRLKEFTDSVEYTQFEQKSGLRRRFGLAGDTEHLALHMGLYSGDYLTTWLGGLLESLGITTFGQLKQDDPKSALPPDNRYSLVVCTSDVTRGRLVYLPWDYPAYGIDPDKVRIVDAVRASMSIPFFFDPVHFRAPSATFDGVTCEAGTITWVDGGLLSNFPVEVFDQPDPAQSRWPTIGIKLSARRTQIPAPKPCDNVVEEAIDCLHTLLDNTDRYYLPPEKQARTIFVDSLNVKATMFQLSSETKEGLFQSGQTAAGAWLSAQTASPAVV